jgi:TonB family protein
MPDPPGRAEAPGRDRLTVRVVRAMTLDSTTAPPVPDPIAGLAIPAQRLSSGFQALPGAIQAAPGLPTSLGPGRDGGAGDGTEGGDGARDGRGLRDGNVYGLGDGVVPPSALYRGTPVYTAEAMRARIEGTVIVACVVRPNGECTDIKVTRSLDAALGLDGEAVKAAGRWRFRPGTRGGKPVPVLVSIEIAFSIR